VTEKSGLAGGHSDSEKLHPLLAFFEAIPPIGNVVL